MKTNIVLAGTVSALISACFVLAYDRLVFRPSNRIAIVDLSEVYRAKEAQYAQILTSSKSDDERKDALATATTFARRLPVALDELPKECNCLVMLKTAVVGSSAHLIDLTPVLKAKLEAK